MNNQSICSVLALLLLVGTVSADQLSLDADKDSGFFAAVDNGTIIPTPNNFGAHTHVPVASANNLRLNRSVFEFDLSTIPSGVTVTSATFVFEVTAQGGPNGQAAADFGLHQVTSSWDEGTGTSNIGGATGDGVTWSMRTATEAWNVLGGDFDAAVIDSTNVAGPGTFSLSSSSLVSVVQDMVDGTVANNGFLMKAVTEGIPGSAARVTTREGGTPAQLLVTFSDGTLLLGDVNGDGAFNLLDVSPFVDLIVSGGFSCEGDVNEDGSVDLLDVAPFIDLISGG